MYFQSRFQFLYRVTDLFVMCDLICFPDTCEAVGWSRRNRSSCVSGESEGETFILRDRRYYPLKYLWILNSFVNLVKSYFAGDSKGKKNITAAGYFDK